MTCITTVIGKAVRNGLRWYYLDDGVYGSFSGQIYDHMRYPLKCFSDHKGRYPSVLAGPTCDSIDVIAEDVALPELDLGELVVGHMMGAYTVASATHFNLLKRAKVVLINGQEMATAQMVDRAQGGLRTLSKAPTIHIQ
jgi:ornithine decarboxylase